jgi:peptide/nickel transport system substrate-binding protein
MEIASDVNKFNRAKAIDGVELRIAGGPNFTHLTVNGSSPNLQDVKVRQAIAKAIDRGALTRSLLGPLGIPPDVLNNHIFMRNQVGYQDNSGDVGKYDPTRAGQMLDEAGWTLQGGVRKKDGRTLQLTCIIPGGVATGRQIAELLQNMLGQVGVKVAITTVPVSDFFDKYVTPGQFDIVPFAWVGTAFPIMSSKSIYAKPTVLPNGELQIRQNYARVGSDEIDRLYAQANSELDRTKAIAIANQIDALIWQEVHTITIYQRPEIVAVKKGVANFGAIGFADPIYQDIGWSK